MRRRELAWVLLGGAAGATGAAAQTTAGQTSAGQTTAAQDLAAARERVKANSAELAKFKIPMATEPAFVFKA